MHDEAIEAWSLQTLVEEHAELREMIDRLLATLAEPSCADRDEQIVVQVRDLVDLLRIHLRKEESLVRRLPSPLPLPTKGSAS